MLTTSLDMEIDVSFLLYSSDFIIARAWMWDTCDSVIEFILDAAIHSENLPADVQF